MNGKRRGKQGASAAAAPAGRTARPARRDAREPSRQRPSERRYLGLPARTAAVVGAALVVLVLAVGAIALLGRGGGPGSASASQWTVPANAGTYTNVNADRLADMLKAKDFTLLNVKTPYFGEIAGTDLYIPYDQLNARASELPADRTAKIVVYCKTGTSSKIAVQTLMGLGYTNLYNLDGGMAAWQASGRTLVDLHRG